MRTFAILLHLVTDSDWLQPIMKTDIIFIYFVQKQYFVDLQEVIQATSGRIVSNMIIKFK